MSDSRSITAALETLYDNTEGDELTLGEMVDQLENRGFGPMILVPALIAMLPTGAIPGIPSACGILICLIGIQMLFGKPHPWLPSRLQRVSFSRDRLGAALEKARPVTRRIDRWLRPRLTFIYSPVSVRLLALLCSAFGLAMIPLELVPLAAAIPSSAIALTAIGLMTRDGVVSLAAMLGFAGAGYVLMNVAGG